MNRSTRIIVCAAFAMVANLAVAAGPPAKQKPEVKYQENLALVPPTDPPADDAPTVVDAMKGKHPRLLFTAQEIAKTKELAQSDPVLNKAYTDVTRWARRFKQQKSGRPDVVTSDTPALWKATGQWIGLAWAYGLDRDPAVKKNIVDTLTMMLNEPYWADAQELDCNMGAGNNMLMTAVLYDTVHDELEPDLRDKLAAKLLTHARRMWYLGHQQKAIGAIRYWQQDPQNNHRWHRAAGLAACLLAVADRDNAQAGYLLREFKKEMDFLLKWYPADGDCHEGSAYQQFGLMYLMVASQMMDRVIGTEYLKHPGLANAWAQYVYYWAPGQRANMSFGDDQNRPGAFGNLDGAFFFSPKLSRDKNAQAAVLKRFQAMSTPAAGKTWSAPWSILAFYDPTIGAGDINAVPTHRLFADLGAFSVRDSWEPTAVAFTFKCGPYGGYKLNEYRHANLTKGKPHYVNIAHDDPDANTFALAMDGEFIFHPGVYSTKKLTETNNAITVDGKGQIQEGASFTQPTKDIDMRTLSYLVGYKVGENGRIVIEGEAARAYPKLLTGFRRTAVWMPGEYILLLDDIRAEGSREIMWRGTTERAIIDDAQQGRYAVETRGGKKVAFQVLASRPLEQTVGQQSLAGRWGEVSVDQVRLSATAGALKIAAVLDPWNKGVSATLADAGGVATLTVKTSAGEDVWTWKPARDAHTPTSLQGKRGAMPLIILTESDKAPHGD